MGATPTVAGPRGRAIWINEPVSAMIARGTGSIVLSRCFWLAAMRFNQGSSSASSSFFDMFVICVWRKFSTLR